MAQDSHGAGFSDEVGPSPVAAAPFGCQAWHNPRTVDLNSAPPMRGRRTCGHGFHIRQSDTDPIADGITHMNDIAELIVCRECDTVHGQVHLQRAQVARCNRCGGVIARYGRADVDTALAIALACAIMLLIANFTPVLGIEVAGTHTEANIWRAVLSIEEGWISAAAFVLATTMLFVPLLQVVLVLWLLGFARFRRRAPGFSTVLVVLHVLRPWSMSEVFLLGSMVAIVKLGGFIPIATGPGIWALATLTLLLAVLGRFDPQSWWALEHRTSR